MDVRQFRSLESLPIVGEPEIFEWRPIVSFRCSCGKGKPLLISSTEMATKCDGCGNLYALHAVRFDSTNGDGAMIALRQVRPVSNNGHSRG